MSGGVHVKTYPWAEDLIQPMPRVAMPRAPRMQVPGGTMHVVARCNNREFCFAMVADFELLLAGGGRRSKGAEGQRSRGEGDSAKCGRRKGGRRIA